MPTIVYVLTNPAMPGLVKIGMTTRSDPQLRLNELYTTGVPLPFECVIAREVIENGNAIEEALHTAFGPYRINPSREFFEIDPSQAEAILRVIPGKDVTPQAKEQDDELHDVDQQAAVEYKRRQTRVTEQEFMESLDDNGRFVFERVLALGNLEGMRVNWGIKGFSLNVNCNDSLAAICIGYPPNSVYGQSIYTALGWSVAVNARVPDDAIADLRKAAQDTGLFAQAGTGIELRCRIDRGLEEAELSALMGWLEAVVARIKEWGTV